jgi:hypothetical protein
MLLLGLSPSLLILVLVTVGLVSLVLIIGQLCVVKSSLDSIKGGLMLVFVCARQLDRLLSRLRINTGRHITPVEVGRAAIHLTLQ